MHASVLATTRVRFTALLLVAMFSFAAIGATTMASASDATAAKKCKKGYKKVGKKCKKAKKKATPGAVTSVKLSQGSVIDATHIEVTGSFTTKKAFIGRKTVKYTIVSAAGTETVSQYALGSRSTVSKFTQKLIVKGTAPFEIKAKIDGKTSNTFTLSN